ncbi:acyl-CoA mutase large subunit family protein [Odoribacter sp. OttesenSCG-928-J03]|nr:acyl-CoA mutase large subunit family protein [Odoribacter sp. OttesenSCG-928-J03]MDL2283210.1 acyl-CoA mutase large subunit family protein [Odoribacter sp. OttesenSCG-928-G04]
MVEKVNSTLFSEFAPNTMQEWLDKVTADLKGADFGKKLVWKTNEGFDVQPMYRLENMKDLKNLDCLPGEFPFVRGNKLNNNNWFVRQDIVVEDVAEANKKALDILNRGVDSLGFVLKGSKVYTEEEIAALLKDIHLDCVEINFICEGHKLETIKAFKAAVFKRGIKPEKIQGGININPLGMYLRKGKLCAGNLDDMKAVIKGALEDLSAYRNFKPLEVDGYLFHNSGSSIVQELAFSLALGVQYLDVLTDAGMNVKEITPRMRFSFATGSKYFMEIAKLRAARYLWAQIVKAYVPNAECECVYQMNIHAETSEWNKTVYDPNVNMLRTQTEAMSAILGGVDSFNVHPFDYVYECHPSELAERVARNQQLLLKEESHFAKIVDAAGGSYYIEELTESIAEAAWKLFLEVQEQGGYVEAVKKGFVQSAIKATAKARDLDIAMRRENYVGTNQFPNFNEKIEKTLCSCIFEPEDYTASDATIETLKPYRGTQAFEALRFKTDQYAANGSRPVVYMFPMGNLNMRKARAQFACNFFACAGFEVMDNNGFKTVDEGVKACQENKAAIVVLCGADDEYMTFAPEAYEKLKDKAILVVAGNPENRAELEAKGLTNFIHVKNNVLEELKGYQQKLGIK